MRQEGAHDYLEESKHWNKAEPASLIDLSTPVKEPGVVAHAAAAVTPAVVKEASPAKDLVDLSDALVADEEFPDLEAALGTLSKKTE